MPCSDHRDSRQYTNEHEIQPLQERVDLYAQWLCYLLKGFPDDLIKTMPTELQEWWEEHKEFDEKRIIIE